MNSGAPKVLAVPAPLVAPVMLVLVQTWWYILNAEGSDCDYDKWNMFMFIYDTDIP